MSFAREKLLNPELEAKLKEQLTREWKTQKTGMQIAKELQFGVPGSPYYMLQPKYIYFYRHQFNLPKREPSKFNNNPLSHHEYRKDNKIIHVQSRYKVTPEILYKKLNLTAEQFLERLNAKIPLLNYEGKVIPKNAQKRAFLITHFLTPLRQSEIRNKQVLPQEIFDKADEKDKGIEITVDCVILHGFRKKKKLHVQEDEPMIILRGDKVINPTERRLVEELVSYLQSKTWEQSIAVKNEYNEYVLRTTHKVHTINYKPFNLSSTTLDNWVKEFFENAYSHLWRFRGITELAKIESKVPGSIANVTFLTMSAAEHYIIKPQTEQIKTLEQRQKMLQENQNQQEKT